MAGIVKMQLDGSDYYIIELQGELKTDDQLIDGMRIGTLDGNILTIGNHILKGQEVAINPPYRLMKREGRELFLVATIRHKIQFSDRPTPIPNQSLRKIKTNKFFRA